MNKERLDFITDKLISLALIAAGILFIYVPAREIIKNSPSKAVLTESQKADVASIALNHTASAVSEAVSKMFDRNDIIRIHVTKGDYTYPEFEIKRGKDEGSAKIDVWTNMKMNGYSVSIGYAEINKTATAAYDDFKNILMPMGCLLFGLLAILWGISTLLTPGKEFSRNRETIPSHSPVPPIATQPEPEPEPVRYDRPRLVK